MNKNVIRTSGDLKRILLGRLEESDTTRADLYDAAVAEREKQEKLSSQLSKSEDVNEADEPPAEEQSATTKSNKDGVDDSLEGIKDRLNYVRAGKSLKDPEVAKNFEEYYDSLTKAERTALAVFLRGISQVLSGEVTGDDAIAPHEPPQSMQMAKTKTVNIKPNVIRKDMTAKKPDGGAASAETPIKPKSK